MDVHVRGIDPELWKSLRLEAVTRGISVAGLLSVMWHDWQREHSIVASKQRRTSKSGD